MKVNGSITEAIAKLDGSSTAVLIIDELGRVLKKEDKIKVIEACIEIKAFVVWVYVGNNTLKPAHDDLWNKFRGYKNATAVKKEEFSAFHGNTLPDLHSKLQKNKIEHLVIVGTKTNQCVRLTAVGGDATAGRPAKPDKFKKKDDKSKNNKKTPPVNRQVGATGRGYIVHTSDCCISGADENEKANAYWLIDSNKRLQFYTKV